MEADKFSIHLRRLRLRVASEAPGLREHLAERGFEVRETLGPNGLLLGRPAHDGAVGRPAWMLYESTSTVLRRSPDERAVFESAAYHLMSVDHATASEVRIPLLARAVVTPDGSAMLFDPYADSDLAGLDRRLARRGFVVLPTTVVSVDPNDGSVVLPDWTGGEELPTGRLPIRRMIYRVIPDAIIGGSEILRLARSVPRYRHIDLQTTLERIAGLIEVVGDRYRLESPAAVAERLNQVADDVAS